MTELAILRGPEDFTPEWFTRILRSRSSAAGYAVDWFRMETLDTVKSLGSEIVRLRLAYVDESDGLPTSSIAKFPATNPEARAMYDWLHSHQREIGFYEEVVGEVTLRTPRCYYRPILRPATFWCVSRTTPVGQGSFMPRLSSHDLSPRSLTSTH